jgi:hypothetical protein
MAKGLKKSGVPAGMKKLVHDEIKRPVRRAQNPISRIEIRAIREKM